MSSNGKPSVRILVVRLGAMGDILHALPAVASLKHNFPGSRLTWLVKPHWAPLLEGNPFVDRLVFLRRDFPAGLYGTWQELRREEYDFAVDFQGLLQSAALASAAHPERIYGFHQSQVRERAAAIFYSSKTLSAVAHVVDRNLDLAAAAGATSVLHTFPLPAGSAEGQLPEGDFVLASPLAGWRGKQWPMEHYAVLATRLRQELGVPLVLNGPPGSAFPLAPDALLHCSGLPGLIDATRRAAAVLGVDSGPLHLAAALGRPGVAVFGPTDPMRNGPYGGTLQVLRKPGSTTSYQRGAAIDESMRQIDPEQVFAALKTALGCLV
ncbi:MAG TPA: glycosyltransferase family 9 protein [Candidatus Sulfopaludibacter sp.]|jgi:heptosyltransferase-1|nr:glycosyltransferase family 9 protein [Candidatus Sulfopaludibacter sp.]